MAVGKKGERMSLLRDQDLIANITVPPPGVPYVSDVELPANPYSKDSPVQASSIDLHIGNIYVPGKKKGEEGGAENPKSDHSLQTGETAVVTTKETLHFPADIAGFGFPPSRVSFKGLLMTNPGHVDPGFDGVLRFTVINMAKDPYHLERGKEIVTLLLFRMDDAAHSTWRQRNPGAGALLTQASISRLSKDFVDVDRRARKIAKDQGVKVGLILTSVIALAGVLLQAVSSGHLFSRRDVEDLRKRQEIVEYDLKNRVNVEQKLQEFDNRLKDLERTKSNPTQQGAKATKR